MRNRSSLVNRSKTSVIVNLRQGNLTSMPDLRPFTQSFYKNHLCTFKSHSIGSSQIMMNISEHGNFSNSVRFCLGDLSNTILCIVYPYYCIYVYINVFNYYILQHIIYICIYPRWLEMFIDKDSGFHYNLTETQEKTGRDTSSNSTHRTTGMWKNTSKKPSISSKQKHSNKMQLQTSRKHNNNLKI